MKTNGVQFPQPLDEQQENVLLEQISNGDQEAKNKLIEHNMRLVFYVANQFKNYAKEMEDLVSIGTIGLIKAVNTFEPSKNIKISTYASRCIKNEILMYLRQSRRHLENVSLQDVVTRDKEGNELSLMETLGSNKEELEDEVLLNSNIKILKKILMKLPERERMIIEFRYGIDRDKMKQTEIAETFDISQSYISRIEKTILKKLKKEFEKVVV